MTPDDPQNRPPHAPPSRAPTGPLARFFPHLLRLGSPTSAPLSGGLSGAALWRVEVDGHPWVLRRWPTPGRPTEALLATHGWLAEASRRGVGFVPVPLAAPGGGTLVECDGARWELSPWSPGQSTPSPPVPPARLRAAGAGLAQFHNALATAPAAHTGPSAAVSGRVAALRGLGSPGAPSWRSVAGDRSGPAERVADVLTGAISKASRLAAEAPDTPFWLQPVHGDPRRAHWLYEGDRLSGLIDYGAMRVDSVALDVARWLGDSAGESVEAWNVGLEAYTTLRPLSTAELQLVAMLDATGVVVACARWLEWHNAGGGPRHAARDRLAELEPRLEGVALGRGAASVAVGRLLRG